MPINDTSPYRDPVHPDGPSLETPTTSPHTAPVIASQPMQLPHTAAANSSMSPLAAWGIRSRRRPRSHMPSSGSHPDGSITKVAPANPTTARDFGPAPPSASIPETAGVTSSHLQGPGTVLNPVPAPGSHSVTTRPPGPGNQLSWLPIPEASADYRGRAIHTADIRRQIPQDPDSSIVAAPDATASEVSPIPTPNVPVSGCAEQGSGRAEGEDHAAEQLVSSRGIHFLRMQLVSLP